MGGTHRRSGPVWDAPAQEWEFHNIGEKAFCQDCEGRGWAKFVSLGGDTRGNPQLDRDFYGDLFVVVDDAGEPIAPYRMSLKRAQEDREDHGGKAKHYRIVRVTTAKPLERDVIFGLRDRLSRLRGL
ncbi:MAG: hypothetical protein OXH66_10035 [Gemmatimonadetes bacterium]|nr:hypothetical protein [Gemmatimonadota bacterium]